MVEEQATIESLHEDDEGEMPRYDLLYDFETYSKVGPYAENETCVVDPCHK